MTISHPKIFILFIFSTNSDIQKLFSCQTLWNIFAYSIITGRLPGGDYILYIKEQAFSSFQKGKTDKIIDKNLLFPQRKPTFLTPTGFSFQFSLFLLFPLLARLNFFF
jgi:hypothetical protein